MSTTSDRTLGRARRLVLDGPDGSVAAVQSGPTDGEPALLVPGYTGSKEDFGPILDPLGAFGFCVTAIDLPGQYESGGADDPAAYSPDRLAATVLAVATRLGRPVHLLGHSFGGLVARAAAVADPSALASLVLLSSGPAELGGGRRERIERLEPLLDTHGPVELYAAVLAAQRAEPGFAEPPQDVADFLERRFVAGSPAMLRGMADSLRREPDRVAELAATGRPVLVAHGDADDAWPPPVQREMAGRLGAEYAVIKAAHSPAVENPEATVGVLTRFWAAHPARA